jgi:hypothetical protein
MRQVAGELCGNELSDDERRAAEEVGVVWDRPLPPEEGLLDKPDLNSDRFARCRRCGEIHKNMDYWFAKLEKIEVE